MTIQQAQGMAVGEVMDLEKLIVYLTVAGQRSTPGLELVAFSRGKKLIMLQWEIQPGIWQA